MRHVEIRERLELAPRRPTARAVLAAVLLHIGLNGEPCRASVATIARIAGVNVRNAQRALGELVPDHLRREDRPGKCTLWSAPTPVGTDTPVSTDTPVGRDTSPATPVSPATPEEESFTSKSSLPSCNKSTVSQSESEYHRHRRMRLEAAVAGEGGAGPTRETDDHHQGEER